MLWKWVKLTYFNPLPHLKPCFKFIGGRIRLHLYNAVASVVELVDTSDSKSDGLCPCRFDSGPRYHLNTERA